MPSRGGSDAEWQMPLKISILFFEPFPKITIALPGMRIGCSPSFDRPESLQFFGFFYIFGRPFFVFLVFLVRLKPATPCSSRLHPKRTLEQKLQSTKLRAKLPENNLTIEYKSIRTALPVSFSLRAVEKLEGEAKKS